MRAIYEHYNEEVLRDCLVVSASSGGIAGICLLRRITVDEMLELYTVMAEKGCHRSVGRMSSYMREVYDIIIPDDDCARSFNGRLTVCYCAFSWCRWHYRRISSFRSKAHLIQVLMASAYLPLYFETPICINGEMCFVSLHSACYLSKPQNLAKISRFLPRRL